MAAITWYLTNNSVGPGSDLSLTDPGAEATRSPVTGWVVSTGATNRSEYYNDVERAATTFVGTTVPDGSLDTTNGDFWVSPSALTGDFASANWTISFACRATTNGGAQDGLIYARVFRGPNQDGSSATEVTSAATAGTTVTNLATSATQVSTVTVNPGAFSVSDEYIFIQLAWERTGAGGMTSADVNVRIGNGSGTGSLVTTSSFTPTHSSSGTLAGTGAALAGTATRTPAAVTHESSGTLAGTGATLAGTAAKEHPHASSGVLAGTGAALAGTAARTRVHPSSGVLAGTGAALDGTAAKEHPHDSSGVLAGTGAALDGTATVAGAPVTHDSSGVLQGGGAALSGTAATPVVVPAETIPTQLFFMPRRKKWYDDYEDEDDKAKEVIEEVVQRAVEKKKPSGPSNRALRAAFEEADIVWRSVYAEIARRAFEEEMREQDDEEVLLLM